MKEYTYTETRQKLKQVLTETTENHEIVRITQRNGRSVILIDEDDYNSLLETAYLLRSPRNAKRLIQARRRSADESIDFETVIKELNL